jgi:predicted phage tail protein
VNWLAPSDNGGSAITSYSLYWKLSTSGVYTDTYSTTDIFTLTHIITGLTAGAYYDIKVQAFNIVGGSAHSGAVRLVAATKPNAPATPTLVSQSSTAIQIQWVAPYNGGAAITSYQAFYKTATDISYSLLTTTSPGTLTATLSSIATPGTDYDFYVVAINDAGTSPHSGVL